MESPNYQDRLYEAIKLHKGTVDHENLIFLGVDGNIEKLVFCNQTSFLGDIDNQRNVHLLITSIKKNIESKKLMIENGLHFGKQKYLVHTYNKYENEVRIYCSGRTSGAEALHGFSMYRLLDLHGKNKLILFAFYAGKLTSSRVGRVIVDIGEKVFQGL